MQKIEQVFISVSRKEKAPGAVIQSAGVLPVDLEAILESAGSFCVPQSGKFDLLNLFFHHLPSGAYAVGRLIPALEGKRVKTSRFDRFYLQYMIVPPALFLRFGNNPVFLYQAVLAGASFSFVAKPGAEVEPIFLDPPRKWFDIPLLRGMTACPGPAPLAKLADTVLHSLSTMVTGGQQSLYVLSAVFNLFPIRFRPELTFSSGLFFAPNRHFRVIGVSGKNRRAAEIRDFCPVPYVNLDRLILTREETLPAHGWQRLVRKVLETGQFEFFQARLISYDRDYAREIQRDVPIVPNADEMDALGEEWLADLSRAEQAARRTVLPPEARTHEEPGENPEPEKRKRETPEDEKNSAGKSEKRIFRVKRSDDEILPPPNISEKLRRWLTSDNPEDGIHYFHDIQPRNPRLRTPLVIRTGRNPLFSPFQRLLAAYPGEEKDLRVLDRMVAAVLGGDAEELERLTRFWVGYLERTDDEHKWRICEEYTHFIQIYISEAAGPDDAGSPEQSAAALDLLNLFLNEGEAAEFSFDAD